MTFWEELRQQVRGRATAGDITYELYDRLAATGVTEVAVIQPTFYLGQFSVLTHDFMDLVEKLLDAPGDHPGPALRAVLYVREAARSMARLVRHSSEPMESLLQFLEEVFEASQTAVGEEEAEEEHEHEHEEEMDEFAEERARLKASLKVKLQEVKVSDRVAEELAGRIADTYHGCVRFTRCLKQLSQTEPDDLGGVLAIMVDLQYVMDFELRRLLLEDVFLEETPTFTTGLLPWVSHAVEELARQVAEERQTPATALAT